MQPFKQAMLHLCALPLLALSIAGRAEPIHALQVGAQTEQLCKPALILAVAKKLGLRAVRQAADLSTPSRLDGVVAAACKPSPQDPHGILVALATTTKTENVRDLTLAIVDTRSGEIIASHRGSLEEDASLRLDEGSLWIDTANYQLSETTRAFGLDVTSAYIPNCGDGGVGPVRTLFVREGTKIRPVLQDLSMSTWAFIQQGQSRCNSEADEATPTITLNTEVSISVANTSSHGFRDLVLGVTHTRDDAKPVRDKPYSVKLSYDGKVYPWTDNITSQGIR